MPLTPRERVLTAIHHQEPDRVPLSLWGSWYGITDRLYFAALDRLGWEPVPPFRPDRLHSVNYYDDRLMARLHIDVRHVDPGAVAATSHPRPDGSDAFGIIWDTSGLYRTARHHPLEHATVEQIMEHPLPTPDEAVQPDLIRARLREIEALGEEYAVIGRAVASYGPFEMAQSLRRHEKFFTDLVLSPEVVEALTSRLFDCYTAMMLRFLDIAGERLDMLELPGDDFAGNKNTMISLDMFDRYFKEPYRRMIARLKAHSPHVKIIFHSDGAMTPFLSRLIDIGADIFHPLEPLPVTDFYAVKAEYGDRLVFMGGIDIREALQGDPPRVVEEVKTRLHQLGPGGGYILAPSNHIQWDVPPENLFLLFDAAVEYGRYPLQFDLPTAAPSPAADDQSAAQPRRRRRPRRNSQ
ncbi:MAG: hypothetical protein D6784_03965 [Chloroflexi bacterium]|nr:MAG: hypothetical protein D6784_03965 [Chloroflexota bacterium]